MRITEKRNGFILRGKWWKLVLLHGGTVITAMRERQKLPPLDREPFYFMSWFYASPGQDANKVDVDSRYPAALRLRRVLAYVLHDLLHQPFSTIAPWMQRDYSSVMQQYAKLTEEERERGRQLLNEFRTDEVQAYVKHYLTVEQGDPRG